MQRLTSRVEALEQKDGAMWGLPAAWIEADDGETAEQARARYEAEHGPLGDRLAVIWVTV